MDNKPTDSARSRENRPFFGFRDNAPIASAPPEYLLDGSHYSVYCGLDSGNEYNAAELATGVPQSRTVTSVKQRAASCHSPPRTFRARRRASFVPSSDPAFELETAIS